MRFRLASLRRAATPRRVVVAILALVLATMLGRAPRAADGARGVWALPNPSESTLRQLAASRDVEVRWVERGIAIVESDPAAPLPAAWRAHRVATRTPNLELGVLRGRDVDLWRKPDPAHPEGAAFVAAACVARLAAEAGEVWVLLAAPGTWPEAVLGCHGGLVVAKQSVDPRSQLDTGPPAALVPWLASSRRPLGAAERRVLAAVSADSLQANLERITLDPTSLPADRWVHNTDLETIYAPRVEAVMARAIAGIAGARVLRQKYVPRSTTPTDSTFNLIARIPGSVPGTGTFVVCAHLDATGQRDPAWLADMNAGRPIRTPGAEDNATGVACVLEMLRTAADAIRANQVDFAFDLEFIAYSAEEIGLVGSAFYVRQAQAAGTPLLGAFNFDMVGYDSLAGNLQVVHNPASRWMADLMQDAAAGLAPPAALNLTPEIDESLASDHNNFWSGNAPAILLADASITTLRRYPTYHTPSDVLARPTNVRTRIEVPKLVEVSRLVLAALMRFDTRAYTQPLLQFVPENLALLREIQGVNVHYDPRYHPLYAGAPLSVRVGVQSLGAPFAAPLRFEIHTSGEGGGQTILDSLATWSLPTGGRADVQRRIPITDSMRFAQVVTARVTYADSGGTPIVQAASDTFYVQPSGEFDAVVTPNPVRGDPGLSKLSVSASVPGQVSLEIYDLEGQSIATNSRSVTPVTFARLDLPLLAAAPGSVRANLASGAYIVRVQWDGTDGSSATTTTRWVVIR